MNCEDKKEQRHGKLVNTLKKNFRVLDITNRSFNKVDIFFICEFTPSMITVAKNKTVKDKLFLVDKYRKLYSTITLKDIIIFPKLLLIADEKYFINVVDVKLSEYNEFYLVHKIPDVITFDSQHIRDSITLELFFISTVLKLNHVRFFKFNPKYIKLEIINYYRSYCINNKRYLIRSNVIPRIHNIRYLYSNTNEVDPFYNYILKRLPIGCKEFDVEYFSEFLDSEIILDVPIKYY